MKVSTADEIGNASASKYAKKHFPLSCVSKEMHENEDDAAECISSFERARGDVAKRGRCRRRWRYADALD